MQQTAPRRGRPRPIETIERDERIYRLIADGTESRSALAAATGLDRATIALCVQRLKRADRIKPCHGANGAAVWVVADGTPCP